MKLNLSGELIPSDWAEVYRKWGYESGFYCPDDVRSAISKLEPGEELLLEVNSIGGSVFSGNEIYAYLKKEGIEWVFYAGVHANMCILNRSFGIKNMLRWGFKPVLIRDLVDIMYNPAKPPYVNHDQALKLVVEYIEKFGCPSACSTELLNAK